MEIFKENEILCVKISCKKTNQRINHRKILATFLCAALSVSALFSQQGARKSAGRLFSEGLEFQEERNWWSASEKYQEALRANPAYADAWFRLAQCVYEMGQGDLALEYVANAKKYGGEKSEILNLEGMAMISLGRLDEARKIFDKVQKRYPNDIDSRFGLAELNLFEGRINGAESLYVDALRRNPGNVKALLSLALISAELGKNEQAERYINQAISSHAENPQVYHIAAYLEFKRGNIDAAERRALSAIQVDPDYVAPYGLLALIYYAQGRYKEVIDLSDLGISRDRNNGRSWYIKGLAQLKMGQEENAISTWTRGLDAVPEDEIMRAAFELLVRDNISLEDARRTEWAKYHVRKAADYAKKYQGRSMRYEYQAALRLEPLNYRARNAFSNLLRADGFSENYLSQIKFIQENEVLQNGISAVKAEGKSVAEEDEKFALVKLSDTVEGYESLLENTLAGKWNVAPFYLDKTRWTIGVYYLPSAGPAPHPELTRIASEHLSILFRGILGTSVRSVSAAASSYGEAYADAHRNGYDYFILLGAAETEREIKLSAEMYSARTGTSTKKFSVYKTGNDSYASALLSLREGILDVLPIRARILDRSGNDVLTDIGRTEGIVKGARFAVLRRGRARTADSGSGLVYSEEDLLGTVTLTNVSEDVSEGVLSDTGFYDRVNARDELILIELPKEKTGDESAVAEDTAPGADQSGAAADGRENQAEEKAAANPLRGADATRARMPELIEMIRSIYD